MGTALLERKQLLSTERFVVDLCGRLDQVLQVSAGKEVAEIYEFAVVLVLDYDASVHLREKKKTGTLLLTIDNTPLVLTTTDVLAINNNSPLGTDNGKGQELLLHVSCLPVSNTSALPAYLDGLLCLDFLAVILLVVVGVHAQVVELELLLYPVLELSTLLQRQAVTLGNDGNNVDKLAQLLKDNNVNGLQGVARWLDEEQAAVDTRVLEVPLTLSGELLAEVGTVLVLDVLDNGVPAAFVVDQVAVAGGVDDVEA